MFTSKVTASAFVLLSIAAGPALAKSTAICGPLTTAASGAFTSRIAKCARATVNCKCGKGTCLFISTTCPKDAQASISALVRKAAGAHQAKAAEFVKTCVDAQTSGKPLPTDKELGGMFLICDADNSGLMLRVEPNSFAR